MDRSMRRTLRQIALVLTVLVLAGVRLFVYRPVVVTQTSMEPTLQEGDRLLVNTWRTRFRTPGRGTVVVLQHPEQAHWVVKRVVGVPNDILVFSGRGLRLNGKPVNESYVQPWSGEAPSAVVGPGTVYVAGDNRPSSEDSRDYGPVAVSAIIGEVVAVISPAERRRWLFPAAALARAE